jgi:HAD superfamily hydrolase (TIGR01509 family)
MIDRIPRRSAIKAVVFNKDGVLADSESINLRSAFEVFGAHGYELAPGDEPAIIGRHPRDYVPFLATRYRIPAAEQRRMIHQQDLLYTRLWREEGRLCHGARKVLDDVRRLGLGVGLATSSSRREVETFIHRFDLAACFDVTLSLDDVARAKPHPEIYVTAARRLGIPSSGMLVVEDSEHGVQAAKGAGAICAAVRTTTVRPERMTGADIHIDSLADLTGLLAT